MLVPVAFMRGMPVAVVDVVGVVLVLHRHMTAAVVMTVTVVLLVLFMLGLRGLVHLDRSFLGEHPLALDRLSAIRDSAAENVPATV
jgi:hypothetical protein